MKKPTALYDLFFYLKNCQHLMPTDYPVVSLAYAELKELETEIEKRTLECDRWNQLCDEYKNAYDQTHKDLDEAKEYLTQLLWVADDNGIHCGICHSTEYAAGKHEPDCPAEILLWKLKDKK
jgi:hypothetical protein